MAGNVHKSSIEPLVLRSVNTLNTVISQHQNNMRRQFDRHQLLHWCVNKNVAYEIEASFDKSSS